MSLSGKNNEEKIWNYLLGKIGNEFGVAGLMGNLYAESALNPNNLQNSYEKKLGFSDAAYTEAVDSGSYSNFVKDSAGYGLAQWTYWSRKQGLLNYAKIQKKSIGDLEMQLGFLFSELSMSYPSILSALKNAASVREASDIVLVKYEAPADQGNAMQMKRASYGQGYYNKYAKKKPQTATQAVSGGKYDKYINSKGTHYISNSGSDENGSYKGGKAGDQTGREWQLRTWYNRPWDCVLRYEKDSRVGQLLAELGCAAALNDLIGYDQYERDTYWQHLKASNYDPSQITIACEADCSAGVIANIKAVGYLLGIKELQNIQCTYTGNMRSDLKAHGFTVLTASKYIAGTSYLLPGDVLLNEVHHTATNVTKGANASGGSGTTTANTGTVASGSGAYKVSKKDAPANSPLHKLVCTGNGVNVRTQPIVKEGNQSKYLRQLFAGDEVWYCDEIYANGYNWYFVKIPCSKHSNGYIFDYVCADYFKKA